MTRNKLVSSLRIAIEYFHSREQTDLRQCETKRGQSGMTRNKLVSSLRIAIECFHSSEQNKRKSLHKNRMKFPED